MTQPDFVSWLDRKPSQKKPRKPLRRVAKAKYKIQRIYSVHAMAFKRKYHSCAVCGGKTEDVHHMAGRGLNLMEKKTWLPVCRPCHRWIHDHPSEARKKGWLK